MGNLIPTSLTQANNDPAVAQPTADDLIKMTPSTRKTVRQYRKIGEIFREYIEENTCLDDAMERRALSTSILKNIYAVGGFCRDLLIGDDVRDIDSHYNTRELCKIQRAHLLEHHVTSEQQNDERRSNCFIWQLYLNNVNATTAEHNQSLYNHLQRTYPHIIADKIEASTGELTEKDVIESSYLYISGCNYLLNANFFATLLSNLPPFCTSSENEFELQTRQTRINLATMRVADKAQGDLIGDDYDFTGMECEFVDVLTPEMNWKLFKAAGGEKVKPTWNDFHPSTMEEQPTQNERPLFRVMSLYSRQVREDEGIPPDLLNLANSNLIEISVPIYELRSSECWKGFDLTINRLGMHLNDLVESGGDFSASLIRALLPGDTGPEDIRNKVLSAGVHMDYVIEVHQPMLHFFRIVKFGVRYEGWIIDPVLVDAHQQLYSEWLGTPGFFLSAKTRETFISRIVRSVKTASHYERWMVLMNEQLGCMSVFVSAFENEPALLADLSEYVWNKISDESQRDMIAGILNKNGIAV